MRRIFIALPIVLLSCFFSCKDDDLGDAVIPGHEKTPDFTLRLGTSQEYIGVGGTVTLQVGTNPVTTDLDGKKFLLLETSNNTAPNSLGFEFTGSDSDGNYDFNIKNKRTSFAKFDYELKIVYPTDEGDVESKPFHLRNEVQKSVSKVYITLAEGLSRATDLDAKTSEMKGYSEDGSNFETQTKVDNRNWIDASIRIENADGSTALESCATKIKGRGNTTWGWAKKPYNLKLDKKASVLGMRESKRWCLIANAVDRTNMRCYLAYRIASLLPFDYSVHNEFAELYFMQGGKEDYRGLYLLTEHIKEDCFPLTEQDETASDISGDQIGYLLEFDMNYDEPGKFLSSPSRLPVNIKYPAREDWEDVGNTAQYEVYQKYISDYVSEVDKIICDMDAERSNSSDLWDKVDIESMASLWIVFETMCSREILWPKSVYFHKDAGGKLKAGPAWDFDYRTLNKVDVEKWINYPDPTAQDVSKQYWAKKTGHTWWAKLISCDKTFRDEVKKQWKALFPKLGNISMEIDACKAMIKEADDRNAKDANGGQGWKPSSFVSSDVNEDVNMTFDEAVENLKTNLKTRIDWMDKQIENWN